MKAFEKLDYIRTNKLQDIAFERIEPNKKNNWINLAENDVDFEDLLPLVEEQESIFQSYFNGVSTNRDEWVYDNDKSNLEDKIKYFINEYDRSLKYNLNSNEVEIKWSSSLEAVKKRREAIG